MQVKDKITLLRTEMAKNNVDVFIVFSADPHMSEYLPDEWKERVWISGFTGSAGWVVITSQKAGLWTDGRYFTQAEKELKGSGIALFKDGQEDTPNYIDWIISETKTNSTIAVNALTTSIANWQALDKKLLNSQRNLINLPLLQKVWTDRHSDSSQPVYVHPVKWAGQSVPDKLRKIKKEMHHNGASALILSALDDIAWTLNLRGSDVECNPVFLSYVLITGKSTVLFIQKNKLNAQARNQLQESGIDVMPYSHFFEVLEQINGEKFLLAPNCNQLIFDTLSRNNIILIRPTPVQQMKAIKNAAELEGFRTVMVRDGAAMVKFLYWFIHDKNVIGMNEYEIGEKLKTYRADSPNFVGVSFDSIVGYQGNGAIIHYKAPESGSSKIDRIGSILIDSGGQYLEGTTDITRTVPLGKTSDEFNRDYTLVLKGQIQLSMAKFPKGTRGTHLDTLARLSLWKDGKDYNHGTGHGVGSFLNVHEGPQNIRKDLNPQKLLPGMVLSNEPGYYKVGEYGIRHENLIAVREWKKTEWNTFYEFETLTFCPFFKSPVIKEMLSEEEIDWLNEYHQTCREKLSPHLHGEIKDWLFEITSPL